MNAGPTTARDLKAALDNWTKIWNDEARPFKWTRTADQILDRICRYWSRISEPDHWTPPIGSAGPT
ncbi:hypothetical protein [Streptomyces hirsutus]|uniref:hypothetical protein n=1 Tax=Streptomyces hirsutus TaxID=35620 RepID=UPI0033B9BB27